MPEPSLPEQHPPHDRGTGTAGEPRAWARAWAAIRSPSRAQLVVAVLLALLAFAAVTQVRLTGGNDRYAGMRQSDLVEVLNGLSAASRRAEADLTRLQDTRDSLASRSQRRRVALQQARSEVASLGILAGTVPAVGPGIHVTVSVRPGHQVKVNDLLDGLEELRDAGAEAMEINGRVRVVAQTWFEEAHGGIRVDGQVLRPPYTFDVIGDPGTLARALSFPGGFKDSVAYDGGRVAVTQARTVKVTVTRAPVRTTWANPAGGG
jgi:uncharacterized protein YlxW (UPF0749 family)